MPAVFALAVRGEDLKVVDDARQQQATPSLGGILGALPILLILRRGQDVEVLNPEVGDADQRLRAQLRGQPVQDLLSEL
ncbi:hypothetical protein GCM10010211_42420 [Streptomyces albospinus]|uniref:Uncharacterized protein n=1 Tax=Streptomyces albospinus TaxID=285515 RepID=A0ABQ2VA63_9ACTN|nr:hypothetical protein GCM10010211_42420 [Streptomyces albospinus]